METKVTAPRPANWRQLIAGAVAEIDLQQIEISRHLTPAQRLEQMQSMIDMVEGIAAYRLRQRQPELSEADALRAVRSRHVDI
ncbi:MAG TPA: hypothetical protein VL334_03600 [Anaerolineae bacterium]|nr:hypothetical protein [Anaerolineae bacterium]